MLYDLQTSLLNSGKLVPGAVKLFHYCKSKQSLAQQIQKPYPEFHGKLHKGSTPPPTIVWNFLQLIGLMCPASTCIQPTTSWIITTFKIGIRGLPHWHCPQLTWEQIKLFGLKERQFYSILIFHSNIIEYLISSYLLHIRHSYCLLLTTIQSLPIFLLMQKIVLFSDW